ncbi:MAG TPA: dolichyl-phosphate beta-glucosyltransferase [Anaerolineales bacterium]|nr:dolichyl-phosphate beta-glucosyltransferase [Anaerolineales bacterium]
MSTPFLSIIIPAHNEEQRLPATLEQVISFLQSQPFKAEILVVENASQDGTLRMAQEFAQELQRLEPAGAAEMRVLQEPRRGKGLAVKLGMLAARGQYRFMCDADLSMPIEEIQRFLPPALEGVDIAIASREAAGAIRYNEPAYRHLVGRIFNTLIRLLALPSLQDTQCGFKCFRGLVAEELFRRQTLTGWSFDVEVLFIARRRGYRIVEIPIPWFYHPNSKISVVKDSLKMALDILAIRLRGLQGVYDRAI